MRGVFLVRPRWSAVDVDVGDAVVVGAGTGGNIGFAHELLGDVEHDSHGRDDLQRRCLEVVDGSAGRIVVHVDVP